MSISATIAKIVFTRLVMMSFIVAQIAAGAVLLAGLDCAQAKSGAGRDLITSSGVPVRQE